jgi:YidC/Oxa1 family membrane protein insertase
MMDKRTLIALMAAMIILFGFQYFFTPQQPANEAQQTGQPQKQGEQQAKSGETAKTAPGTAQPGTSPAPAATQPTTKVTKQITVDTPLMAVTFADLGGAITSVKLKGYKETVENDKRKEVIEDITPYRYTPTVFQTVDGNTINDATIFSADKDSITIRDKQETVTFSGSLTNGRKVKKSYTFTPDTYTIGLSIEVEAQDQARTYADFTIVSLKEKPSYAFKGPFVYDEKKKLEQIEKMDKPVSAGTSYIYSGFDQGYFSFIWIPDPSTKPELQVLQVSDTPVNRLAFGKNGISGKIGFAPNKTSVLKQLHENADKIVDFGWFDIVAKPMLWGMNYSNRFTRNYGIDIILLTILIKIIFYPLSLKSYKSMKEMQKLQPMIAKLREKYKDDKEKLNKEMMGIYKTKGINPLGGCLPMIIQIPVFFALYKVLMGAIEFRHAPFMWWINDLAAPEDLFTFHVAGYALPIRILPLVMGITMVLQQKMTPTTADPMQNKMMMFMPIFFTFLFWGFPAGLVLYWLVNNVISIGQQYYINKQVA